MHSTFETAMRQDKRDNASIATLAASIFPGSSTRNCSKKRLFKIKVEGKVSPV